MEYLNAIPHKDGLEILKEKLYEKLKDGKFILIDTDNKPYFAGNIHKIFFDNEGVLTFTFVIPKDEHLTNWNKRIKILSNDNKIITIVTTPEFQFIKGVGGEQVVKLAVSGKAGNVIFKKDEYLTEYEAVELLLAPHWEQISTLQFALLKKEIEDIDRDKKTEEQFNLLSSRIEEQSIENAKNLEHVSSGLYSLIVSNSKAILELELQQINK